MFKITMTKIFLCLCLCLPVIAQSTVDTPESVAKEYIAASTSGDWAKAATFIDPEALVSFKNMFGEVMKMDKKNEAGKEIFGLKNNAEFDQLSGEQVFVKLISMLVTMVPQMRQMLSEAENTILGQVPEGNEVVHILYRMKMKIGDGSMSKVDVMSLKKSGTTWRLKLSEEMEGSFSAMAKSMLQKAQEDNAGKPPAAKRPVRKK
jgi:hypothetical protein